MATFIFDHADPNVFQSTFNSHKVVLLISKNLAFFSRDTVTLKILQFDWPRAFWSISQEPDFPQIWDLSRNIVNNIKFHLRQNLEKVVTKFSNNFFFSSNKPAVINNFTGVSNNIPKFRKN